MNRTALGTAQTKTSSTSVVSSIIREDCIPVVILKLADGRQVFSYLAEIT